MRLLRAVIAAALVLPAAAQAAPISDVPAWTQSFEQAAIKGDVEALTDLISGAAAPGLDAAGIKALLQAAVRSANGQRAESAEPFNERDVGSFLKRVNVAVIYEKNYLFYSVALGRHQTGWMIYNFRVDGNINNILNAPWP